MEKTYLSREGYEKLRKELDHAKKTERHAISKDIAAARAHGDLKENAEYHAAREAQSHLEAKIAELERKLSNSVIIDEANIPKDAVYIGATVKLLDTDLENEVEFTLVPEDEANFSAGKISVTSPLAKGLLGKKVGEVAVIKVPARVIKYKVLEIRR